MTVSIVAYRSPLAEFRGLVGAVLRSTCVERLIVVDNGRDPVLKRDLAAEFPRVEYQESENRGFGAGHNLAIRLAMSAGSRVHLIVNPDVSFEPGVLERLDRFMAENPSVGVVSPTVVYPDGRPQFNARMLPTPFDSFARRFLPTPLFADRNDRYELRPLVSKTLTGCGYLCGCMLCFRTECLREIGLFDERYFLYPEDIDICRRINATGRWSVVYFPEVTVVHRHARESYRRWRMTWTHIWNMVRYYNKWGWFFDSFRRRVNRELNRRIDVCTRG